MSWRSLMIPRAQASAMALDIRKISKNPPADQGSGIIANFANVLPDDSADDLDEGLNELLELQARGRLWSRDWETAFTSLHGYWPKWGHLASFAVGRLHRISMQRLAAMTDEELRTRLNANAERLASLEVMGYDDGLAEVRGLRAELRWALRNRTDLYLGLLAEGQSQMPNDSTQGKARG